MTESLLSANFNSPLPWTGCATRMICILWSDEIQLCSRSGPDETGTPYGGGDLGPPQGQRDHPLLYLPDSRVRFELVINLYSWHSYICFGFHSWVDMLAEAFMLHISESS